MRNLVSLRRQLWPLESDAEDQHDYSTFTLNIGEQQGYLLHAHGRIDTLDFTNNGHQELLIDLRECIVMESSGDNDNSLSSWKWIYYLAELDALVCASRSGVLVTVDVNAREAEEIGTMSGGIRGIAWSTNQEMVAVVTGVGTILIMNTQWEVLHEIQLDAFLPADATRVEGSNCEVCWRDDAQYLVINVTTHIGNTISQQVMIFTGQLEFHALGRLEDGRAIPYLGGCLDWSPNQSLIATSEVRKDALFVVFFERNGLRHGEFALPTAYRASLYTVDLVKWNIESDILAVALSSKHDDQEGSIFQLWTRNNYHWYLKQEICFHLEKKQLIHLAWDEENATLVRFLTRSVTGEATQQPIFTLQQEEFTSDVSRCERQSVMTDKNNQIWNKSIVVTGIIDGKKLLLTPLHEALVPPPSSLRQIEFEAIVNSVVFDSQHETLLVLLSSGDIVLVENYLMDSDTRRTTVICSAHYQFVSLLWMQFDTERRDLSFVLKSTWRDQLVFCSTRIGETVAISEFSSLHDGVRRAGPIHKTVSNADREESLTSASFAIQSHSGAVYVVKPVDANARVTKLHVSCPVFSQFIVVESGDEEYLVVGLHGTSKLYVNDKLITTACSSFRYDALASVLLYTLLGGQAQLRMMPLNALREFKMDVYESRMIERGAKLVAVIGARANVVVQMPRGNLECITPRLLVLLLVIKHIERLEYVTAIEMCRKHRLDLNLLVDFNSEAFLKHFQSQLIGTFLTTKRGVITSDRLCLFITNLHPVDVWRTKYKPQVEPFLSTTNLQEPNDIVDKINVVCQAMMVAIQKIEDNRDSIQAASDQDALLLPFLTCTVKQTPPQYVAALLRIQALHREASTHGIAKRAIKHLILLTQVDLLYDEALGLYDLDLVRFVATYSQRDPKEYAPLLDELMQIEDKNLLKYRIDVHLNRHERALTHLSALLLHTEDDALQQKYEADAIQLVQQGFLYDLALQLFPSTSSPAAKAFRQRILILKAEYMENEKKFKEAAYIYLSVAAWSQAMNAFLAAKQWQMALSLACKVQKTAEERQSMAYQIAQDLINQQEASISDILAAARIYVEYCDDMDEAIALLVLNKQWEESLRLAYLHNRPDLIESDIESGVLQLYDDILEELTDNEARYTKHWKRLSTIREQKRLFKLHGIDGCRWQQDGDAGDGDSVYSGASSAAHSALSNASMRSIGSHNSALSIGNFSMKSLAQATSSHFYATQTLSGRESVAGNFKKEKNGGMLSRRERRNRMKEGSVEEEQYIAKQVVECQPNAALKREVKGLLQMLVYFGHLTKAQRLQSQLRSFEERIVADKSSPFAEVTDGSSDAVNAEANESWQLAALQG